MVRGDVFRKKWLKPILVQTNQIPIFRFKDGFSELRKNDANLQEAYKALDKEAAIILFIEGGTINIKKLRPFQKGLARMASSYLARENSRQDLMILPVAINFVSPFVLRSRVVLNIGEAYKAKTYFNDPEQNTSQIKQLTDDLYKQIKPKAFHVSQDERQDVLNTTLKWAEGLCELPFYPIVSYKTQYWNFLKSISNTIDDMDDDIFISFSKEIKELGDINPSNVRRSSRYLISTRTRRIPSQPRTLIRFICKRRRQQTRQMQRNSFNETSDSDLTGTAYHLCELHCVHDTLHVLGPFRDANVSDLIQSY